MGNSESKGPVYSVPISQPSPGETAIYRNAKHKDALVSVPKSGARTIQEIFLRHFEKMGGNDFLGYRKRLSHATDEKTKRPVATLDDKYTYMTFAEVFENAKALGSAIETLGLAPTKSQFRNYNLRFIGIHGKNSVEWVLTDIANICYGYTSMPLYDTLGDEAVEFMLHETELTTLFLTSDLIKKHSIRMKAPSSKYQRHLKTLVIMDEWALTEDDIKELQGIEWYKFSQLIEIGKKETKPARTVTPDDIMCFSYTSGTTGLPKGAMISHKNLIATIAGAEDRLYLMSPQDVYLSYLPLAHVLERIVFLMISNLGAKYSIFGGDVLKLKEDLAILKPTLFVSVPRLFNKFHDAIKAKTADLTGCKASMANKAMKSKLESIESSGEYKHCMYDSIVFKKMQEIMGGNIKFMLTGSAPLSLPVKQFLKVCFCCPFLEGYGQTEGCGGQFVTDFEDKSLDTVGGPLPMNEFKLIDVPEMKYFSTDVDEKGQPCPRGEILCRGHNIIPGYYKNEEKNKETFDSAGWLRSGDIGMILPGSGALKIIDRRKNIFKLSHGEYVAPDKLEQIYKTTLGVADIFVYGDSLKSVLVAIINLDEAAALKLAQENAIKSSTIKDLATSTVFNDLMVKSLRKTCDVNHLKGFERIVKLHIDPTPFATHDLITTTFKLKRVEAREHYKVILEELYRGQE